MALTKLLVLDPLTLVGREFLSLGDRLSQLGIELDFRHTAIDDETQIAELANDPALVEPLDSADDLEGHDAVLVASESQGSRHDHLLDFMDRDTPTVVVDLSRIESLMDLTTPSVGREAPGTQAVRVAHPALVVTTRLVEVLRNFGSLGGTLAIVDPVSVYGREGIDLMARQTRQRLNGEPVTDRIYGHVRTFNVIATDGFELQEEAAHVLPNVPLAVTHSLSGVFHGHLAHIGLSFVDPVEPDDVRDALSQADGIEIADLPANLNEAPDRDFALITPPVMSPDSRHLALTAMADGLRIGGALTALDILESLV